MATLWQVLPYIFYARARWLSMVAEVPPCNLTPPRAAPPYRYS
jgi:hypothetical protein